MEGTLTIDSPSLRNALHWTGQEPPGAGGFGRFALKARANVVGASIALTNVNVELDGNVAEGVMTYANNGRQTLQATLAADTLDFTPYISTFRLLASGARDWNRQMFDLNALSTTDLDMRLSAARVTVGPTKLGRTAFGANLARRRAGALGRRGAGLWRRRQGLVRRRPLRHGRRRQGAIPVPRCRPAGLRRRIVRHQPPVRPRQSQRLAGRLRLEPVRPDAIARRQRDVDRP